MFGFAEEALYMPAQAAAYFIRQTADFEPEIGLILGSGLGGLADELENRVVIDYADIPDFPKSTAPGHKGRMALGELSGKKLICMQGRFHYYEGWDMEDIALPVRTMKRLGIRSLIVTNAAGGVNPGFEAGDLMLIADHINLMGVNPLRGANDDTVGPRFPDMSHAYPESMRALARKAAQRIGIPLREGVYLACSGPSYETPAEIRAFRTLGADAVGMSTVPEVIAAVHCGLPVLGISLISNMAAGISPNPLSGEEVIEMGKRKAEQLKKLVSEILYEL